MGSLPADNALGIFPYQSPEGLHTRGAPTSFQFKDISHLFPLYKDVGKSPQG